MTTETKKLSFACTCNGCRNYPTMPAQIWHESQIPSKESTTHYFSRDAMRLFSTRIVDFHRLSNDALLVLTSSRYGYEGAERYYEIVMLCKYGVINREGGKYDSLRAARKYFNDEYPKGVKSCECHGCQLDQAGR